MEVCLLNVSQNVMTVWYYPLLIMDHRCGEPMNSHVFHQCDTVLVDILWALGNMHLMLH